jgi:hypothetical protein
LDWSDPLEESSSLPLSESETLSLPDPLVSSSESELLEEFRRGEFLALMGLVEAGSSPSLANKKFMARTIS